MKRKKATRPGFEHGTPRSAARRTTAELSQLVPRTVKLVYIYLIGNNDCCITANRKWLLLKRLLLLNRYSDSQNFSFALTKYFVFFAFSLALLDRFGPDFDRIIREIYYTWPPENSDARWLLFATADFSFTVTKYFVFLRFLLNYWTDCDFRMSNRLD